MDSRANPKAKVPAEGAEIPMSPFSGKLVFSGCRVHGYACVHVHMLDIPIIPRRDARHTDVRKTPLQTPFG